MPSFGSIVARLLTEPQPPAGPAYSPIRIVSSLIDALRFASNDLPSEWMPGTHSAVAIVFECGDHVQQCAFERGAVAGEAM